MTTSRETNEPMIGRINDYKYLLVLLLIPTLPVFGCVGIGYSPMAEVEIENPVIGRHKGNITKKDLVDTDDIDHPGNVIIPTDNSRKDIVRNDYCYSSDVLLQHWGKPDEKKKSEDSEIWTYDLGSSFVGVWLCVVVLPLPFGSPFEPDEVQFSIEDNKVVRAYGKKGRTSFSWMAGLMMLGHAGPGGPGVRHNSGEWKGWW